MRSTTSELLCRDGDFRGQAFGQRESRGVRCLELDRPAVEYDLDRDPLRNRPGWYSAARRDGRAVSILARGFQDLFEPVRECLRTYKVLIVSGGYVRFFDWRMASQSDETTARLAGAR